MPNYENTYIQSLRKSLLTKLKRDLNPAARALELPSSTPIESEKVSIAVSSLQILAAEL